MIYYILSDSSNSSIEVNEKISPCPIISLSLRYKLTSFSSYIPLDVYKFIDNLIWKFLSILYGTLINTLKCLLIIWVWKINSSANGISIVSVSLSVEIILKLLDDYWLILLEGLLEGLFEGLSEGLSLLSELIFLHSSLFLYFSSKQEQYVILSFVKYKSELIEDFSIHLVYISLIKIKSFLHDKHCISLHKSQLLYLFSHLI